MKNEKLKKVLLSIYHYAWFFLLIAFLITCCMSLFVSIMMDSMNIEATRENVKLAAAVTFGNVVFLSLICTAIDAFRRKLTIERPVKQIVDAAEQMTKGNFDVRVPDLHSINRADGLDKVADCFNKMAEELSGMETLRTDFIANVSHELKTPLAVMQNYGALLQQPDLSAEERVRYAKSVADASRRMADLITNILKLNKLENQQIYPEAKSYCLSEQLCECMLRFEEIWDEKEIELDVDIEEDVYVKADAELLSLVWNNLISNALKFTEHGGKVGISLKSEEDTVIIMVSDTGCGIDPKVGAHIFEKFYQGDTSHATQGNGLGLALVKRVIDILNGEIYVASELGKGSTFTVKLKKNLENE